jgi:hypothetical protein
VLILGAAELKVGSAYHLCRRLRIDPAILAEYLTCRTEVPERVYQAALALLEKDGR